MPRDPLIGLVGKPSSGKSTTLNSLTDATSKVGKSIFPFQLDDLTSLRELSVSPRAQHHYLQLFYSLDTV